MGIPNEKGEATRRVVRLFEGATDDELHYGLTWYERAHEWATSLARETGVSTSTVAGVIAALSPQTPWPQNKTKARELLTTGDTYGFTRARNKAKDIALNAADPLRVLTGPKERAFYSNLADPLGSDAVTVDRHAVDAAAGLSLGDAGRKRILERKGGYEATADIYRSAARHLGVKPHVVQAVVWAVWRNRTGRYHFQYTDDRNRETGDAK